MYLQARERSGAAEVQRSLDRAVAKQRQAEEQARCLPPLRTPAHPLLACMCMCMWLLVSE